jgi:AcrR family transcriptional regulator
MSREQWVDSGAAIVSRGRPLTVVPVAELEKVAGKSKGSLYAHFRDIADLRRAVIAWWQGQRRTVDTSVNSVADPLEQLRVLRSAVAGNAPREHAMRWWEYTAPEEIAPAMAEADRAAAGHAARALEGLGYPVDEAEALGRLLAVLLLTAEAADWEVLLRVLTRAAAAPADDSLRTGQVDVAPGADAEERVFFTVFRDLPEDARARLREEAQRFAEAVDPGLPGAGENTVA